MTAALTRDALVADLSDEPPVTLDSRRAHHVLIRPAPRREPPFDDEIAARNTVGEHDQRLPFDNDRAAAQPDFAPLRQSSLVDPAPWARRLLVGLVECAGGRRPLPQLATLLSPSVARGLGSEFERSAAAGRQHWLGRAAVRSVRATEPGEGVAELCATLESGPRVRAVALRLEERHGRWCCTRLQLG